MSGPTDNLHPLEAAQRQRSIILRVVRIVFLILIVTFTLLAVLRGGGDPRSVELAINWWQPLIAALVLFGLAIGVDLITPKKKISTISGVLVGVLAGMLATLALGWIIDLVIESWLETSEAVAALKPTIVSIKILLGITLCYLGVTTVLQTQDDFRLVIPYVEFAKQIRGPRPLLLDSSVLIDARVADAGALNLFQAPLVIPHFVVAELQLLADSGDAMRRARGRRGLETVARLQRAAAIDVSIDETPVPGKAVDQMLVELARQMSGMVVTTDTGLARVAGIQSVPVLNLNDLALALKPNVIPGEPISLKLIRPGEQHGQAVGYLADGTMVVAEDGAASIGQQVTLIVTSQLQTSAGRLIFGRLNAPDHLAAPAGPDDAPAPSDGADATLQAPRDDAGSADAPARPSTDPETRAGPFPTRPPRSLRAGTPRNPRR